MPVSRRAGTDGQILRNRPAAGCCRPDVRPVHVRYQHGAGRRRGLAYPADLAPLICLTWMVLGFILLGYFMIGDRSRIAETRWVFTEQTPAEREAA